MADEPGLTRVVDAVRERATEAVRAGDARDGPDDVVPVPVDVAVEIARTALRRLPDAELTRLDVWRVADHLVAGAQLLADRRGSTAVAIRDDERSIAPGARWTAVQLATDDRPFLLSTVLDELERRDLRLVRQLHPIVGTDRDEDGTLRAVHPGRGAAQRETLLHLVVDRALSADEADELADRLHRLVDDVRAATGDFPEMRATLLDHAAWLRKRAAATDDPGPTHPDDHDPADDPGEVAALLDWLLDDHAVLLGVRRFTLLDEDGTPVIESGRDPVAVVTAPGSGAGLLGREAASRYADPVALDDLEPTLAASIRDPRCLTWSRTRSRSTVQRRVRMEHLALGVRDEAGRPTGVLRVLALFTRRGEDAPADATPVLRRKLAAVLDGEDIVPGSHDELILTDLFQALPKDELFPVDVAQLRELLVGLMHAEDHREIRALLRVDVATRTVSILVAVPRDTYSPQLRDRLADHLRGRFDADRVDVDVALGDRNEALARYLLTLEHDVPEIDAGELEDEVRAMARSWVDEVRAHLTEGQGAREAERLIARIARRLPRAYRDANDPEVATADLLLIDRALDADDPIELAWRADGEPDRWRLRVVARGAALELSAFLPVLESLGVTVVDEVPYGLLGGEELHLHDVGVRLPPGAVEPITQRAVRDAAAAAIRAAWRGHAEIDPLTRLVLLTDLSWRDVGILRAYRRYRRQLGTPYTPAYVEETLVEHAAATSALLGRFRARFDPAVDDGRRAAEQRGADEAFETAMADVARLDADRILRGLSILIDATVRTNAFRHDAVADGSGEPYVALKFDPSRIPELAPPVLHREVFVHSPRVEGVHLRAGAVARGGLRWSDRRDDVRSEVMGLVKAQVLKNALIVPTGAKGGFVLTRRPADPQALRDEVERQYVTFIRGLLDVTDGLGRDDGGGDQVLPPPAVVRHDGDDSYLVVAADKGTATFSDTANAIAGRYGFWLGDAFASGGSRGYDHKVLGVTAKGAWRAVARHFRELGVDVATETITVAGVGDMSGDVFSNGVQRSDALQLVAAFDHRHIFVDPDPDPARSFAERQRVADLGRSSWDDYDRDVLSPGGFIVPRDVRSVTLTPEAKQRLRIDEDELSPPALIRAILGAPVDLLWAGGIGTYIRASDERGDDISDRANDEVRVAASAVRARVLGEGANLFLTQRARIELARRGARVDQDSLHNAAGVATSDAEVNLKILLDLAIADGRLAAEDRDEVLSELAEDVVEAVLTAVDRQVAAVSAEVAREVPSQTYEEFLERLEEQGELDRQVEVLPSAEELTTRSEAGGGLTRPELTTLLAWSKRELKEALLDSDAPEDPVLSAAVTEPFPARAVERFGDLLPQHRLRRELVATAIANDTVDHLGITVASSLAAETGLGLPAVARAIRVATRMVDAHRWWVEVDRLAEIHGPGRIRELASVVDGLVVDLTTTLLGDPLLIEDPVGVIERDTDVAAQLLAHGFELGSTSHRRARVAHARWLVDDLVEPDLARLLACAGDLAATPDVSRTVAELDGAWSPVDVADVTFRLAETLGIDQLRSALERVPPGESWGRRQRLGVARDLQLVRRDAAAAALQSATPGTAASAVVDAAVAEHRSSLERARRVVADASSAGGDLHAVAVAVRELRDAVRSPAPPAPPFR